MPTYYVNSSSTGTGNGTTTAITGANAAFKTIAEVNAATFAAGDSILFNRGDTWREQLIPQSGSASGYVTYGAYGSGNKPKLLGSVTKNSTGDWTNVSGNVWSTPINLSMTDSFTDNSLDPNKWTNGGGIAETNNEIEITSTTAGGEWWINSVNIYDFTGGSVSAKLVNAGNQALTSFNCRPILVKNNSNGYNVTWRIIGGNITVAKYTGTTTVLATDTYVATTHKYLRIRENGGTTYWDYSANNIDWTNFYSVANPITITGVKFYIDLKADAEASASTIKVDDFSLSYFASDVGNIIFDNETSCGVKVWSLATLDVQDEFWYDRTTLLLKVYSVGNPATVHSVIECEQRQEIITGRAGSFHHINIENLDLRYGLYGITFNDSYNINIRNNNFAYIGGGNQTLGSTDRLGNCIEFWNGAHDMVIEKNRIDNVYDAALTTQGNGTYAVYNIYFRNNIITNSEFSFEIYWGDATSTVDSVYFENNTCVTAGGGFGHNQRPDGVMGMHINFGTTTATLTNLYIRNNIFSTATENMAKMSSVNPTKLTLDYNCWNANVPWSNWTTDYSTIATWRTYSSQDAHSISSNPLLNSDYTLQGGSPCIDTGLTIATVTDDYWNRTRAVGRYDIGVLEYGNMGFIRTGKFGTDKFGKGKFGRKPF